MAQKTIQGSDFIAKRIKDRRNELNLTIEEAAQRAGVGTKTWSRYEAGESIRKDKCKGILKALNWRDFPNDGNKEKNTLLESFIEHNVWSEFLAKNYGNMVALSFAIGSDMLLGYIEQDLSDLASMPVGSHIGQLSTSFIKDELPAQFLMRYGYDFLYNMRCALIRLQMIAKGGGKVVAHSVLEELVIYLSNEFAKVLIEISDGYYDFVDDKEYDGSEDWSFNIFDDMDIVTCLYSDDFLEEDDIYHFNYWNEQQFYTD